MNRPLSVLAVLAALGSARAAELPANCKADPQPAVEWRDTKNIRGPVWDSLEQAGFKDRWNSLCPSERLMAALNTHIKSQAPNLQTSRGCDSDVYRKQMSALEAYMKDLGPIPGPGGAAPAEPQQRFNLYKQEFDVICSAYQTRVRQNRAAAWGYGWLFDFRPDKSADWTMTGPVPTANNGARPQGICTEWADDISKSLAGPWTYWTINTYDRKAGAAHTAVSACPKTNAEVAGKPNATPDLLCDKNLGFILDPWSDGKAELFTPKEFNDVSNALGTYAEIMNPGTAYDFYANWLKKKL